MGRENALGGGGVGKSQNTIQKEIIRAALIASGGSKTAEPFRWKPRNDGRKGREDTYCLDLPPRILSGSVATLKNQSPKCGEMDRGAKGGEEERKGNQQTCDCWQLFRIGEKRDHFGDHKNDGTAVILGQGRRRLISVLEGVGLFPRRGVLGFCVSRGEGKEKGRGHGSIIKISNSEQQGTGNVGEAGRKKFLQ